jgi:hypothetical protein
MATTADLEEVERGKRRPCLESNPGGPARASHFTEQVTPVTANIRNGFHMSAEMHVCILFEKKKKRL